MTSPVWRSELRNEDTIRAYLDEVVRLKTVVQFWLPQGGQQAFETTLEQVKGGTFSSTRTPPLSPGQTLQVAFMLDAQRFTAHAQALAPGVFSIPASIAHGERRAHPRGAFEQPGDRAEVYALEHRCETFLGGRTLQGRLLDLSARGLRFAMDEFDVLTGPVVILVPGDRFEVVNVTGLHHTPPVQCHGTLVHLTGATAGLLLDGLSDLNVKNLARILAPRFPPTFGQDFPTRKRKTDLADRLGAPTPTLVKINAPEVVEHALEPERELDPAPARPERPPITAVMRLRKASRRILLLSAQGGTAHLADAFRQDGFKQVYEAHSFVEAQNLAKRLRFDLVLLDNTMSGHWGRDLMKALRSHQLLLDAAIILVAECRNDISLAIAEALDAIHLHERRQSYEDLLPVVYSLLL